MAKWDNVKVILHNWSLFIDVSQFRISLNPTAKATHPSQKSVKSTGRVPERICCPKLLRNQYLELRCIIGNGLMITATVNQNQINGHNVASIAPIWWKESQKLKMSVEHKKAGISKYSRWSMRERTSSSEMWRGCELVKDEPRK